MARHGINRSCACRLVGPWLPWPRRSLRKFSALMKPVVEERLRLLQDHGNDWSEKPVSVEIKHVGAGNYGILTSNSTPS